MTNFALCFYFLLIHLFTECLLVAIDCDIFNTVYQCDYFILIMFYQILFRWEYKFNVL